MKIPAIDFHCDTLLKAFEENQPDLYQNNYQLDWKSLLVNQAKAQFMAIFLLPLEEMQSYGISDDEYVQSLMAIYQENVSKYASFLKHCNNYEDYLEAQASGKLATFLTLEDGRSIQGDMSKLEDYYEKGVRLITLTWNHENCIGYPNSSQANLMSKGLKKFGFDVIERMQELGMMVDVSHLSDGGFWDVIEHHKSPILASHSNCRSLVNHPRNLTDPMIKAIAEKGGVVGLNFAPTFLDSTMTDPYGSVEKMSAHVRHLIKVGGEDIVALGSDFDGISGKHEIKDASMLNLLSQQLKKDGLTNRQMDKFHFQNAQGFLKHIMN